MQYNIGDPSVIAWLQGGLRQAMEVGAVPEQAWANMQSYLRQHMGVGGGGMGGTAAGGPPAPDQKYDQHQQYGGYAEAGGGGGGGGGRRYSSQRQGM